MMKLFNTDRRAQSGIRGLPALIVMIVIAMIFLGMLAPIGFDAFFDADTTGWDDDTVQVWDILPVIVVLVILGVLAAVVIRALPR